MSENNFLGLSSEFIDTLTGDDLQKLSEANKTIQTYQNLQKEFNGENGDIFAHIKEVAARQAAEAEACERVRNRFK